MKNGLVCDRHNEYAPNGVCQWCDPEDQKRALWERWQSFSPAARLLSVQSMIEEGRIGWREASLLLCGDTGVEP